MRLIVFGWGNDARGDDGLGPLLLGRLARENIPGLTAIEDFQLQIEHSLDLDGADLSLFIDAGKNTPAPFVFAEIGPKRDESHTTHALSPEAVLDVYQRALKRTPPPAFALCVRGENFELGEELSTEGAARLEAAWALLQGLMQAPSVDCWRRIAANARIPSGFDTSASLRSEPDGAVT